MSEDNQIQHAEDSVTPGCVIPLLQSRWLGGRYLHRAELASTNDELADLARAGAPHGTVLVADCQSAGKGRLGRRWISPAGQNLYFSLLLRHPWRMGDFPPLSLVVALAVARGLEPFLGAP